MLSLPQNMATCGSATANPVPALAASAWGADGKAGERKNKRGKFNGHSYYRAGQ